MLYSALTPLAITASHHGIISIYTAAEMHTDYWCGGRKKHQSHKEKFNEAVDSMAREANGSTTYEQNGSSFEKGVAW